MAGYSGGFAAGPDGGGLLDRLYLSARDSAARWLLDPGSGEVQGRLREAAGRTSTSPVDPLALAEDLPWVVRLIRERHFGVASGLRSQSGLNEWAMSWEQDLRVRRPNTWASALTPFMGQLRDLLRDSHVSATGEGPPSRPVAQQEGGQFLDPGPAVDSRMLAEGVLYVRLRALYGEPADLERLRSWSAAGGQQLQMPRIVVDLRGNPGGDDTWVGQWISDFVPPNCSGIGGREWRLGGAPWVLWNAVIFQDAVAGSAVPDEWRAALPVPSPDLDLTEIHDEGALPTGTKVFHGSMLVVIDSRTASSGESAAWLLHRVLGASIGGQPSSGTVAFGNLTPYLLPNSGMVLHLGSVVSDLETYERTGLPVTVELDVSQPIERLLPAILAHWPPTSRPL